MVQEAYKLDFINDMADSIGTVSYTHLDVYKRQVFNAGGVKDVLLELFNKIIGA